ncbi:GLPGLI family protein [Tenuifilum thalassicum]|uniref:GLPGLI family protein n=1 Tax=Tenuifilum thalassicum TaxID=2590900 RepID=A0A7D4BS31_9BACT|nr:GLPGLI family protein [Tenuifilum thalassicum]QKG80021.1 GLPGLI family protein [Tenuifilum thalassicum]
MRSFLVLLYTILSVALCYGQHVIDTAKLNAKYKYTFYPDSNRTTGAVVSDMILQIGNNLSRFTEYTNVLTDSLTYYYPDDRSIFQKMNDIYNAYANHTFSNFSIYKDFPSKGNVYFLTSRGRKINFSVVDKEKIYWILDNKSDTLILGYSCKKAYASFRGRKYIAWYTTEIPINDGPYKFRGLPGLIVLIHDRQDLHRFEIAEVTENSENTPIFITSDLSKYKELTPMEFVEVFYAENMNFLNRVKKGEIPVQLSKEEQIKLLKKFKSWNNFIEKF